MYCDCLPGEVVFEPGRACVDELVGAETKTVPLAT